MMKPDRFDRNAWFHLVMILFWLVFAIGAVIYRFTLPTDGWLAIEAPGFSTLVYLYQENILGAASDLQPGDQVIAVEGVSLTGAPSDLWSIGESWEVGETVLYTVLRGGQELIIDVPLVNWDVRRIPEISGLTPASLVGWVGLVIFLVMGFLAFWRRPDEPAARALWVLSGGIWVFLIALLFPLMIPDRVVQFASIWSSILITAVFTILLPPAFIRFALVFPKPKPVVRRHPWISFVPYGVGVVGIGAFLMQFYIFGFVWTALSVLIAVAILIHNAFTMRDAVSQAQLRWGLGGMIAGLGLFFMTYIVIFGGLTGLLAEVLNYVAVLGFGVMGIGLGMAVLRYRLFDIDVIIRKTLVYSALTVSLALLYFGLVTLLQSLSASVVGLIPGLSGASPVIIVLSTLAIAALFNPLRRRIQDLIDRRFYRKKYDAEKALAQFAEAARNETDIKCLNEALLEVVQETVQPKRVSIWLRK